MKILIVNAGSSSLKYQLFDMDNEAVLAKGKVERIGMDTSILSHEPTGQPEVREVREILDHTVAFQKVVDVLTHKQHGVIHDVEQIEAVGHRVVHGGETFASSAIVNEDVKREIVKLYDLAPLHNPAHMTGILAVEAILPSVPQVVVFDTAFHQTMPSEAYLYPIPMAFYKKHQVRRYGFHGTSHHYVARRTAEFLERPLDQLKIISCHIGNGASVAAVLQGRSIDTSMGMTPLEGLMMGTRSGDLDPAIVPYAMAKEDLSVSEVSSMLNKHSGLIAVSGVSSDMREIEIAMAEGNRSAQLAFDMFAYRLRKYIGAYTAAMDGLDVLVFTAGIGENSIQLRKHVCSKLSFFNIKLDEALNGRSFGGDRCISSADSGVKVLVIPTNEELVIARDTFELVKGIRAE